MHPKNLARVALVLAALTIGALLVGGASAGRPAGPPGQATLHIFMGNMAGIGGPYSTVSDNFGHSCVATAGLNCYWTYRHGTVVTLTESDCSYFDNFNTGATSSSPYSLRLTGDNTVRPHPSDC